MWVLFVTIGAIWTGYRHRLQSFLDSEYLAVKRLTMCAYPLVLDSHDFDLGNVEIQKVHQFGTPS